MADPIVWLWNALNVPMADLVIESAKKGGNKLLDDSANAGMKFIKVAWTAQKWIDAEIAYRQKLLATIRVTKILGNPTQIDVDKIYTDVYVFDKLSAIRRYNESIDEDEHDVRGKLDDRPRIAAKGIVDGGGNVFILGRPGAGKTTFLKYLAMNACKGLNARTPIFVSLKEWSDSGLALYDYIVQVFEVCSFPQPKPFIEALLSTGKALVLLDGLDEVNQWQDKRNQIIRDVVTFSKKYEKNQYCLTCRTASTDYSFENFQYVEVADFTEDQQKQFAIQWYGKHSEMRQKFLISWEENRHTGLRELGRTPLLLTLLCLSFDESHTFPKRLVDIYQEAINALTKKWDTSRLIERDKFYKELSYGQRQQLLETIASHFFFNSRTVFRQSEISAVVNQFLSRLPDVDSVDLSDGAEVVRQIESQHGLVVERAQGLYTFSHLTIQEYFTASYISKNQDGKLQRQIVRSAINDQKWREVMLYTVALLPVADTVLEEILSQTKKVQRASLDVSVFLMKCYATARLNFIETMTISSAEAERLETLRDSIDRYISGLRHPPLTTAELTKFSEHVHTLLAFLRERPAKSSSALATGIVTAAASFLSSDPLDAGKLLGGYFIKPEQFINYFYACRLFIECLDISITGRREDFISKLFAIDDNDIQSVEDFIRGTRNR